MRFTCYIIITYYRYRFTCTYVFYSTDDRSLLLFFFFFFTDYYFVVHFSGSTYVPEYLVLSLRFGRKFFFFFFRKISFEISCSSTLQHRRGKSFRTSQMSGSMSVSIPVRNRYKYGTSWSYEFFYQ